MLGRPWAGTFLFLGAAEFSLCLIVSEALYAGYSLAGNVVSDLGVGSTALLFNGSAIVLGVFVILAAWLLLKVFSSLWITSLLLLTGIGAVGVGTFPETTGLIHSVAAAVAFVGGALSAIAVGFRLATPMNLFSWVIGALALFASILFAVGSYLGLGPGGMERMIVYPELAWVLGLGGYLLMPSGP